MDPTALLGSLSGPAAAVIVLAVVLYGLYLLAMSTINNGTPIIKSYIESQQEGLKDILTEHRKDRQSFERAINILGDKIDTLETDVATIKTDVNWIGSKIAEGKIPKNLSQNDK